MNFFKKLFAKNNKSEDSSLEFASLEELETLAEQENAEALYWLGRRYHYEEEVEFDIDKALELYHKSYEKGFGRAANGIGSILFDYEGNYEEANIWFEKAVKTGNPHAMWNLGKSLLYGDGIEQNTKKAIELLEKSAQAGLSGAYQILGDYFAYENTHENAKRNHELSIEYYLKEWELQQSVDLANAIGIEYKNYGKYKEAIKFFTFAVNQGLPHAMYNLAAIYESEAFKDYHTSRYWWEKAAENNLIDGMYWAGRAFMWDTDDIKPDYQKAIYWLEQAAEYGFDDAYYTLGTIYKEGLGVEKDLIKSKKYYKMARYSEHYSYENQVVEILIQTMNLPALIRKAENNEVKYQFMLGEAYRRGWGVQVNEEEALKWLSKATEQNHTEAMFSLARMYDKTDLQKSFELYTKLAEQDFVTAIHNLGNMYLNGEYVEKDYKKAKTLFERSAELGELASWYTLGLIYDFGYGVPKDINKAITCYQNAGNQNRDALYNLAYIFYHGDGVEQSLKRAFELFHQASDCNSSSASYALAIMYENGEGTKKDKKKALEYYQKAMEQGHEDAKEAYERLQNIIF